MMGFVKMYNFCSVKDTVKRMRRQVIDGARMLARHVADKEFVAT